MAKQLNVNLNIDAQTGKAKQSLNELNKILTDIQTNRTITVNDKSLQEAKQAASDLKFHLAQATSVDTGKLNLGAFSQSLKKAGQDLNTLYSKLSAVGPEGQKAFLALSQSIVQADHASLTLGNRLSQLGTTLKNTARWQLSSSLLHGFMGALQGAYGYAQDLNQSLNNIRIVTGQSIDQMAKFADEANRAARELSTTTTRYTDAALIYYQQGLTGKAVTDRVEATVKLANVSRQSAEEVSSQMTAIWNNFDDGSKKLEYYADVITALGAATASSSDEIAQGLQKFAAVADTVGLSYEKATAALATVVAETRQSADVVGTAFKTMFARFQGVTLGETLEDGVGLNKYSKALATVGVDILEANGNLKDMDTILDELGEKWNQIGNAQQVALAETVAGTRQYAQFMAIMENYDKILANQQLGASAEGTLEKQAQIYAESWEAARDRVKAALQGIYSQLLDDNAFISGLNGLEKFISAVGGAIKGLGGLKSILLIIGSIITSKYANEMPAIMQKLAGNFSVLTGAAEKNRIKMLEDANAIIQQMNAAQAGSKGFQAQVGVMQIVSKMTTELEQKKRGLSQAEIESYQQKIKEVEMYGQVVIAIGKEIDALKQEAAAKTSSVNSSLFGKGNLTSSPEIRQTKEEVVNLNKQLDQYYQKLSQAKNLKSFLQAENDIKRTRDALTKAEEKLVSLKNTVGHVQFKNFKTGAQQVGEFRALLESAKNKVDQWNKAIASGDTKQITQANSEIEEYITLMEKAGLDTSAFKDKLTGKINAESFIDAVGEEASDLWDQLYTLEQKLGDLKEKLKDMGASQADLDLVQQAMEQLGIKTTQAAAATKGLKNGFQTVQPHAISISEQLSRLGSAAMSVASAINAIKNLGNIWNDEDASTGEKIVQTLMAMGMLLPAINTLLDKQTLSALKASFSLSGLAAATTADAAATGVATGATIAFGTALKALPIGLVLAGIGLLVGAIAGLAKLIVTPEEKLKGLKEAGDKFNNATEEAINHWKELNATVSNYEEAYNGIAQLTKGTKEFANAVKEANDSADTLINELGMRFGEDYIFDANGVKKFTASGQKKISSANVKAQKLAAYSDYSNIYNQEEISALEYDKIQKQTKIAYDPAKAIWDAYKDLASSIDMQHISTGLTTPEGISQAVGIIQSQYSKDFIKNIGDAPGFVEEVTELLKQQGMINTKATDTSDAVRMLLSVASSYNVQKEPVQGNYTETPYKYNYANFNTGLLQTTNLSDNIFAQQYLNNRTISRDELDRRMALKNVLNADEKLANRGLSEEQINEMVGKGKAFKSTSDYEAFLQVMDDYARDLQRQMNTVNSLLEKSEDKDFFTNLLQGNLNKISPEDMQRIVNGEFGDDSLLKQVFDILFPNEDFDNFKKTATKNWDINDVYLSQVKSIDEIRESIKKYNKELKSLKLGDVIDLSVYDELSDGAKTYFQLMEDGTYKLVGNAQQLQDVLFKEVTSEFDSNLQQYSQVDSTKLTPEQSADISTNAISYAMAAETLDQLNYVKERFNELGVDTEIQTLAENAALQDLATKYESCKDDLEAYQHALATNNATLAKAAKETLEYSIRVAELAEKHGFDAKETEAYAKRLKNNLADGMKEAGFSEKQLEKSALSAAIANQRLDRGLTSLNKNLESYKKSLSESSRNSIEWSNAMESLKTDLADILDMDISVIADEFAESLLNNAEYSELLTQALDGNVAAIKRLREIAADNMMSNIQSTLSAAGEDVSDFMSQWERLKTMMAEAMKSGGIDQTELVNSFNDLIEKGHMTKDQIEAALAGLHVAADVETTYHEQEVTVPTTITEEHFERGTPGTYEYVDGQGEKHTVPFNTYKRVSTTYEGPPATVMGYVPTYKIKGTTGQGTSTSKISKGNPPPKGRQSGSQKSFISDTGESFVQPSSEITTDAFSPISDASIQASLGSTTTGLKDKDKNKGGGGSQKPATTSAEEHIDEEHRYDELNKQLEGLSKQYDRLGKARDRAWGKNKVALLEQELQKLKQMQKVYEKYLQTVAGDNWKNLHDTLQSGGNVGALIASGKAGGNLQKDFNKIVSVVKNAIEYKTKDKDGNERLVQVDWRGLKEVIGIDVMLNEFGEIANQDDIEEAIERWWNNTVDWWNGLDANEQAASQDQMTELQAIKAYVAQILNQYSETVNTFTENSDKLMDNFYAQQDKFYEEFRYKVDLKVEISERSLKRIEYAIKVLGDNIYKVPEVMQTWFDQRVNKTKDEVKNLGSTWSSAFYDAQAAYNAGQISQADYVDTIKDAQDGLYQCIDELLEINEEMREYYKNVLSKVKEEMSRITDEMDHQLNTFTHLTNVLSLLGRETDYEALGVILNGQLKATRNGYEVSKAQTEMYRRQVESAEAELQALMAEGVSDAALEEWKNAVLYPAKEALLEAEAEMQADFEAYLEVINAIYENKINKIYADSERRLSGAWNSFDEVNKAMERQHALDDEYLTKTNQIYETNTLLRKLAQDIDKTNNQAAKTRIKNFSDEIEGLQQKTKLSKSELDIAKARYEVLLAEIALEDARNAKSTVRLQRDNEGNYGYVYTADADAIGDAEQGLEDKKNDLYNLVLGQANDYTEKIIQLTQERNAALQQLDMDYKEGRIKDEETYNMLKADIINKYNDLIQADYESYYRALEWLDVTAATDHTEAWGTSFQDILTLGEDFENETNTLMAETGSAISELNALRAEATEEAKVGAGELEQQVEELTKANDELAQEMTGEVIPAMETVLTTAQQLTAEWVRQYDEIMALIDAYLGLIDAMNAELNAMADMSDQSEEFDMNKDYSLAATQKYLESGGVITQAVLDELTNRAKKEELNGGHNSAWATNEQILEMMSRASAGDQEAMGFLQSIAGGDQFYRSSTMDEFGVTGEGYSIGDLQQSIDQNVESNQQLKESLDNSNTLQEETGAKIEESGQTVENAATTIQESGESLQTSNEELGSTLTEAKDDMNSSLDDTAERVETAADDNAERLETAADESAERIETAISEATSTLTEAAATLGGQMESAAGTIAGAVESGSAAIAGAVASAAASAASAASSAAAAASAAASISSYDTGGYTGTWGSTGKLAVLHEKELVLNADDTENIVSAVGMLREFSSAIDLRAAASNLSSGLSSPNYSVGGQVVEQDVTIHAEFPNATNHSEIEEAFNTLINRASQYANRH